MRTVYQANMLINSATDCQKHNTTACWSTFWPNVTSTVSYMRPLDLCSACLVMLQCQQPCMTCSTG